MLQFRRALAVLLPALAVLALGAPAALAVANINSVTFSSNPTAGTPMTISVSGTADPGSTLTVAYSVGAGCTGSPVVIGRHAISGGFSVADTFTPPVGGQYCGVAQIAGPTGSSSLSSSFSVAGTPAPPPATPSSSTASGATPSKPKPTTGTPPSLLVMPPSESVTLHRGSGNSLVASLHLAHPADATYELLIGAFAARRLGIDAPADAASHGSYVLLARRTVRGLAPGWQRRALELPRSYAARLHGAGRERLALRVTLSGGRVRQVATLHTSLGL